MNPHPCVRSVWPWPKRRRWRISIPRRSSSAAIRSQPWASACCTRRGHGARCREQLSALSGRSATFHTACALIGAAAQVHLLHMDVTTVVFRTLSSAEIDRYVQREQPFDCAGSFKAESLGHHSLRAHRFERSDGASGVAAHLGRAGTAQLRLCPALRAGAAALAREDIDDRGKISGQRRTGAEGASLRPLEADAVRMQEHAPKPELRQARG